MSNASGRHEPLPDATHVPSQAQLAALSVSEVRSLVGRAPYESMPALVDVLHGDGRAGVARLAETARRAYEKERSERERVLAMYGRMRDLGGAGVVLGVDEVGRGPVAGPLTVAAVALPDEPVVWGIDDSKRLSPSRREELAAQIFDVALAVGIAHVEPEEIDACGMAASLRIAMHRAIADAGVEADAVLIDGLPVHVHPRETAVVKGDAQVACIAAASIVAKVTRDAIMVAADELYPGYGFASSKGYASPEHIAAIKERGLTPYHRSTFCRNFLEEQDGSC